METINRLTDILVTMNTPTDRGKLFKIIKLLYGLMGLPFSEEAEPMDAIVEIMFETVCTARKTLRIAGDDYPAELVKAKFMKLDSSHIQFVFDCMRENTTKIRNIKQ